MTDVKRVREIIQRLEGLGLPTHVIGGLKQWVNQREKEGANSDQARRDKGRNKG